MSRHSGWHRALDTQMECHKWCISESGKTYNVGFMWSLLYTDPDDRSINGFEKMTAEEASACVQLADHLAITLWRGDTIYITSDMLHVIMQAAEDLPDDVTINTQEFMSNHGFCMFEEPIIGYDRNGEAIVMSAIAWEVAPINTLAEPDDLRMGLILYFLTDTDDVRDRYNALFSEGMRKQGISIPPLAISHFWPGRDGDTLPVIKGPGTEAVVNLVRFFIAMQMLSRQTIGEPIRMRPDRASRKRYAREYPNEPERLITLITLRRKTAKHNDEPQKVEWSRRWIVRGHWRKQYYPSTKTHGWKYIYEYIKGPEDKPLVTGRRVFDFRR